MSLFKNVKKGMFVGNKSPRKHNKSLSESENMSYTENDYSLSMPASPSPSASHLSPFSPQSPFLESKTKPTDYTFLILDVDPHKVWDEQKQRIEQMINNDQDICKVYKKIGSNLLAHTKIVDKFSDDYFDDYLVEMGILDECHLKFEDRMNEIDLLRRCQHENIIKFYEAYYFDAKIWIFTELCSGGSLDDLIIDLNRGLNVKQIHYVTSKVLSALVYLHEKLNYVHHDLRAANILVAHDGEVKLSNFSISAKQNDKLSTNKGRYSFIASPHWTPPETALSERLSDNANYVKADSWSLGITCIELADKYPPYNHISPEKIMSEIKLKSFKPSLKDPNRWPYDFNDFLNRCLTRLPDQRPKASELIKHQFIVNNQSKKEDLVVLLSERKAKFYDKVSALVNETHKSLDKLRAMRNDSATYLRSHFRELKSEISNNAMSVIEQIKNGEAEMLRKVDDIERECLDSLKPMNQADDDEFKHLEKTLPSSLENWRAALAKSHNDEEALAQTKREIISVKEQMEKKANELKHKLLLNKDYSYHAKHLENDQILGELNAIDSVDLIDKSMAKLNVHDEFKFREKTKMIRLELPSPAKPKTRLRSITSIPEL